MPALSSVRRGEGARSAPAAIRRYTRIARISPNILGVHLDSAMSGDTRIACIPANILDVHLDSVMSGYTRIGGIRANIPGVHLDSAMSGDTRIACIPVNILGVYLDSAICGYTRIARISARRLALRCCPDTVAALMSDQPHRTSNASPALVALAGWIIPGGGYLLLKEFSRGITVGITILVLFVLGLLVGGIRCLEVPGYDAHGHKTYVYYTREISPEGQRFVKLHIAPDAPPANALDEGWILFKRPMDEIRGKPWNIPQIMVGPIDVLADWWSARVSVAVEDEKGGVEYVASRSHSHVNELGVLYTAVAGLLNLMAIIDASHRASHSEAA